MQVNGTVCLAFYYHMWGYHMGALEVYVKQAGPSQRYVKQVYVKQAGSCQRYVNQVYVKQAGPSPQYVKQVYVKQAGPIPQYAKQWSVEGDQGNVWLERRLTLKDLEPSDQVTPPFYWRIYAYCTFIARV